MLASRSGSVNVSFDGDAFKPFHQLTNVWLAGGGAVTLAAIVLVVVAAAAN